MERLRGTKQVSRILNVSEDRVRKWYNDRELRGVMIGSNLKFSVDMIKDLVLRLEEGADIVVEYSGEQLLTTEDVADMLDCSVQSVNNLRKSGKLRYINIGNRYRFRPEIIEAYIQSISRRK